MPSSAAGRTVGALPLSRDAQRGTQPSPGLLPPCTRYWPLRSLEILALFYIIQRDDLFTFLEQR